MLPALERSFDVLALDLPGFGRSPPLPAGVEPTPVALADAVAAAMDDAGWQSAHLAGNSLGGWIALELARRGRARTCVALSPAGLAWGRERDLGRAVLGCLRWIARNAPPPEALMRNPLGRTLFAGPTIAKPWRADPDDLIEQTRLLAGCPGWEATLERTFDGQIEGLDEIRVPVLVLWGTRDVVLIPRQGRRFKRLIEGADLRFLKGCGHVPMSDDPEGIARAIAEFAGAARP